MAVAAVSAGDPPAVLAGGEPRRCFGAKLAGEPSAAGKRTTWVLAGYRRTAAIAAGLRRRPEGGRDRAAGLTTCHRPRARRGRGVESNHVAPSSTAGGTR